ncbi:MAG TPA: hypothetical protein VHO70_03890, partial [Chitinispirillaceae bacterium]|nr:hypothetical protein [Chitinispirillaceae bacterium]
LASEFESVSNGGAASIRITTVPSTLWRISETIMTSTDYDEINRGTSGTANELGHQSSQTYNLFNVSEIIRNMGHDSLNLYQSDTAPLSLRIAKSHYESEKSNGYMTMPDFLEKKSIVSDSCMYTSKIKEIKENVSFSFFYEPFSSKTKSTRFFSLSGWDMNGSACTYEQNCNSEEGCTDKDLTDEAEEPIEVYVGK